MFSPLILMCTINLSQCQTPPAPLFLSLDECEQKTAEFVERSRSSLPPNIIVVDWVCYQWNKPA